MSEKNNYLFTNILATISLMSVALLWCHNIILFALLLIMAAALFLIERSNSEIKTFLFCAICGMTAEYIAISFGAWNYQNPNFFNIPIWLPLLWGIASVFIVRAHRNFSK